MFAGAPSDPSLPPHPQLLDFDLIIIITITITIILITIISHEIIADVGVDLIYLYLMGRSRPQLSRAVVHIQANRPEKYGKGAKVWKNVGKGV